MPESMTPAQAASAPAETPSEVSESQESTDEGSESTESGSTSTPAGKEAAAVEDAKDTLSDPKASKTEKKQAQKLLKKYDIVVDGKSETMELDLNDDEAVKKHLQRGKSADNRFKEAADIRKAALDFIEQLRKNPRKVLADPNINVDLKKFAQEIINEEVEQMAKSPEQRDKEKLQKELEDLKEKFKTDEETRKQQEFERLQAEQERKLTDDISSALDTGGLPKTPYTVKKMAEMMMIALQNDIDLSAKDVVPIIRKQMQAEIKEMLSASTDDVLEEFLKDQLPRIRKRNVAKAKEVATASSIKATAVPEKSESKDPVKKIKMKDFFGI